MKNPLPHSNPATLVSFGMTSRCQWNDSSSPPRRGAVWSMKLNGGCWSTRFIRRRKSLRSPASPCSSSTPDSSNPARWTAGRIHVSKGKRGANGASATKPPASTIAGRLELALDPERRELVRHHPVRPAGLVRATPGTPAGENLGRGLVLVTGAEDAFGSDRPHGLGDEVGRPPRPLGGDDHPAADDRILPELGHRSVGGGLDGPLRGRGKRSREGANPQEGLRGQSPRSDGGYSYGHLALLFASQGPLEERGQRLRRRLALEEHRADLLADGHAHGVATRERERRGDRPHPLGDHAGLPLDGGDRLAAGERDAELAVARETPGAREDEVAQARESREGRGRSAQRNREPGHLREPPRGERRAGGLAA